ncbi:MAG: CHAT domain-containing protein [Candidatus Thiodiazotropha sp.]
MKSILVEFTRFDDLQTGILRKGDKYLRTINDQSAQQVKMSISHESFKELIQKLRYISDSGHENHETERLEAVQKVSNLISDLLRQYENQEKYDELCDLIKRGDIESLDEISNIISELRQQYLNGSVFEEGPLIKELNRFPDTLQQIDLVANAAELSSLPFEAALSEGGTPLFLRGKGVVLTRRVRGDFNEKVPKWPIKPRVLFAWSEAGGEVPYKAHRETLLKALSPWLPKDDPESVFVEIGNATSRKIKQYVKDNSFTHFHLLAHGQGLKQENDVRFGIVLNHPIEGPDLVKPEHIVQTLDNLRSSAVVITLAACDLGNQGDVTNPEKSLAHELHVSGFPVVIASQLPLTITGSEIFVEHFYKSLFNGLDVREALHTARVELYKKRDMAGTGHDWLSLVGYVQLREGYANFLEEIRLKSQMNALTNLHDLTESIAQKGGGQNEIAAIGTELTGRIDTLNKLLLQTQQGEALDENRGLLGSAEKRLAELYFRFFKDDTSQQNSRHALERSCNWYLEAFTENPSHHWSAVQYLALSAALTGQIDNKKWKIAYRAAEVDRMRPDEYWALGSLAELALLGELIGESTDETATFYLQEMKERFKRVQAEARNDDNPFQSTELQLRRYVEWWLPANGYFPGTPGLADEARTLIPLCRND